MPSLDEDFEWQQKFRGHFSEIAGQVAHQVIRASVEQAIGDDDWKRNTDYMLSLEILTDVRAWRISARARRRRYASAARRDFTIRYRRPSGTPTEMAKLLHGWGDLFIYGVESAPGSSRLDPWFVGNSALLRDYLAAGGWYGTRPNADGSSTLAYVCHDDMPLGFILLSSGVPACDRDAVWGRCRRCYWNQVMPMTDDWQPGDGYWRKCLACGFQWRSGWVMRLTREAGAARPGEVMS